MVLDGALSPGALSSFLMYSLYLGFSTAGLSSTVAEVQRSQGASQRIIELMDQVPTMRDSNLAPSSFNDLTARPQALGVRFDAVSFAYPARPDVATLDRMSIEIAPGERVGITGVSGCGKSTLFRLLSRLYDVDSGAVKLLDPLRSHGSAIDIRDVPQLRLRGGLVGIVPQEPILVSGSIAENIVLGCGRTDIDLEHAVRAAGLEEVIKRLPLGLDTQVGEQGVQLSGGEKQRIAIARLIVADPPIVLLDEFTSALDKSTAGQICANLRAATKGRTLLAIVHDEDVLAQLGVTRRLHLGVGGSIFLDERRAT
mmetsp:Transcript_177755/g.564066  ORF Transcript_177755/g.564066 Transcript_177755/m.564066 type:complete len:312 (-) Transcript_177755:847-1782(-)